MKYLILSLLIAIGLSSCERDRYRCEYTIYFLDNSTEKITLYEYSDCYRKNFSDGCWGGGLGLEHTKRCGVKKVSYKKTILKQ